MDAKDPQSAGPLPRSIRQNYFMSELNCDLTKDRRRIAYSIVAILLLLLFCFGGYSIYRFNKSVSPSDLALRKKLVGAWIGAEDETNTMVFRADGTCGSLEKNGDLTMEFEWAAYGNTLQIYSVTGKRRLRNMFGRHLLGEYGLGGKIEDISGDQLQVLFYAEGKRRTFTRAAEAP